MKVFRKWQKGKRKLTVISHPSPASNVRNCEAVANEISMLRLGQLRLHGAVEAKSLIIVPVDAVLNLCLGVSYKDAINIKPRPIRKELKSILPKCSNWPCIGPRPPTCHIN